MATSTLKILRDINGKSQQEIAEEVLGINQNTYSRLEQNPKKLTADQAQKLAEFYKVGVTDLLSEAAPIVTFKDTTFNDGGNGFIQNQEYYRNDTEVKSLKEEIAYLRQQNSDLVKALSERK